MRAEQVVYSLNCPQCGSALGVDEGRTVVTCPACNTSCRVSGQKGLWRFQIRPGVSREQVLEAVPRTLSRLDLAPGLKTQATVQECFLVYLPYWRAWMRAAAWLFGRKAVKNDTVPKEKVIAEDFTWTDAACDVGEFGLQSLLPHRMGRLEPFDREALQRRALVLEPAESSTEALEQAENAFVEKARQEADLKEIFFERFQFLQQKLSLVYYPLWVVRYRYRERAYHLVFDGRRVVSGRAPGNPLWQAAALVAALLVAATLSVDLMMQSVRIWTDLVQGGVPLSFDLILLAIFTVIFCLGASSLATALLLAGYSFFRLGGERMLGGKQRFWDLGRASAVGCLWGTGWLLVLILAQVFAWRHEIIIPAFVLTTFAALGLGWWTMDVEPEPDPPLDAWLRLGQAQPQPETARPELTPLQCLNCQTPVRAREGIVVYRCQGCGWGLELGPDGLRQIDIAFAAPQPVPRGQRPGNLPFWVFDGQVEIRQRKAVKTTFMGWETGPSPDRGQMWQQPRRFYVPAFGGRLEDLETWGVHLTLTQPDLTPGKPINVQDCVRTEEEARCLAEFIFLRIEADKRDVLQDLDYSLTLMASRLVVIPFVEKGQGEGL
ncbi:MAG: hypothetical protein JXM73_25625 [Anaerolineae bacterium]|nr:hypothetical protein [Anaerolineae bacterium]